MHALATACTLNWTCIVAVPGKWRSSENCYRFFFFFFFSFSPENTLLAAAVSVLQDATMISGTSLTLTYVGTFVLFAFIRGKIAVCLGLANMLCTCAASLEFGTWIKINIFELFWGQKPPWELLGQLFFGSWYFIAPRPGELTSNNHSDTHLWDQYGHDDLEEYHELKMTSSHCCTSQDRQRSSSAQCRAAGDNRYQVKPPFLITKPFVKRKRQTDHENEISTVFSYWVIMQRWMSLSLMTSHLDHVIFQLFLIFRFPSANITLVFAFQFVHSRQALLETVRTSDTNFGAQYHFKRTW